MALNDIWLIRPVSSLQLPGRNLTVAFNLLHYRVTAEVGTGATIQQVAQTFSTIFGAAYKTIFDSETRYEGMIVGKIFPLPIGSVSGTTLLAGPGTRSPGEKQPAMVSGIITKRTAGAGRRFRGRAYIPFPLEDDNGPDGKPSANYVNLLLGIATEMLTPRTIGGVGNTTDFQPCLFHGPVGAPPRFTDLLTTVARAYWGIQRKRNPTFHADSLPNFVP